MHPIGCPSYHLYQNWHLKNCALLKHMISGGSSKNGYPFTIFRAWLQNPWIRDNIRAYIFLCYISFSQMFYTVVSSSVACLYAYTPNVPSNVYERCWFCSCKCNVLINPPSKTSSCQAVSIIWSECQQAPILCSLIPAECRMGILAWTKVFCLVEMSEPYVLWHQYM